MKNRLETWILMHTKSELKELYFQLNSDIPTLNGNMSLFIDVPKEGKMVCALHPDVMSQVAWICYQQGVRLIQV